MPHKCRVKNVSVVKVLILQKKTTTTFGFWTIFLKIIPAACSFATTLADKFSRSVSELLNALTYLVPTLCPNYTLPL